MAERIKDPQADESLCNRYAGQALAGLMSNRGFIEKAEAAALKEGVPPGAIIADVAFSVAIEMVKRARSRSLDEALARVSEASHG